MIRIGDFSRISLLTDNNLRNAPILARLTIVSTIRQVIPPARSL